MRLTRITSYQTEWLRDILIPMSHLVLGLETALVSKRIYFLTIFFITLSTYGMKEIGHHFNMCLKLLVAGQKFALMEEKTVLSYILRNYKIHAVEKMEDLTLMIDLILRPESGIKVRLEPRTPVS